ncbi:MAG TPA: hypothetical protein VF469_41410, partial [Kofleriaceae bacterium]
TALTMHHRGAIALLRSGEIEAGRAALTRALRGFGERLPRLPRLALFYEALRLALRSRTSVRLPLSPQAEMRLDTLWTSATALSMYDPRVANPLTLRFVRRALATGEPRWVIRALALEAAFLSALGGRLRARAERTMAELRARAAAIARPYEDAWVAATEGSMAWLSGDIRRCYEWISHARELFLATPETGAYELTLLDSFRLPAMALLGHHDAVSRIAEDVLATARVRGDDVAMLPCLHGHITLAYLGSENIELATTRVNEAIAITHHARSPMSIYHQTWSRATIALFHRDGEQAYRSIMSAWRSLHRSGILRLEAIAGDMSYLRARCALAVALNAHDVQRARLLRDAKSQARWLRGSALASASGMADVIEFQVAMIEGRDADVRSLANSASNELAALGLVFDSAMISRWLNNKTLPIDRVYIIANFTSI